MCDTSIAKFHRYVKRFLIVGTLFIWSSFAARTKVGTIGDYYRPGFSRQDSYQIGRILASQGLESNYVRVIICRDLVLRGNAVVTDAAERSSQDRSIHGYKKLLAENPSRAKEVADRIIKNTYRTLMTRGQKGCYVFCVDEETNAYFKRVSDRSA